MGIAANTRGPRNIEENLERIANALEVIAGVQTRLWEIVEWNKDRLAAAEPERKAEADHAPRDTVAEGTPVAPSAPVEEAVVRQPHQWTYEALKTELQKRGVEVAKGTKMTTLLKFWELHKNDPELRTTPGTSAPTEAPAQPAAEEAPAQAPAAPATSDRPLTAIEARTVITGKLGYTGTPEQVEAMKKALASLGKTSFRDLVEGEYEKLVAAYEGLRPEGK